MIVVVMMVVVMVLNGGQLAMNVSAQFALATGHARVFARLLAMRCIRFLSNGIDTTDIRSLSSATTVHSLTIDISNVPNESSYGCCLASLLCGSQFSLSAAHDGIDVVDVE